MSSEHPINDNDRGGDLPPPIRSIVVGATGTSAAQKQSGAVAAVVDTTLHRAVHKIRLSALAHNYSEVESAANRQKCSVIVVVKADGYGHGAIPSALYLADTIGADAFAVATLEEGIALRKALQETDTSTTGNREKLNFHFNVDQILNSNSNSGGSSNNDYYRQLSNGSSRVTADLDSVASLATNTDSAFSDVYGGRKRNYIRRAAHIRILVLGPPVGFPRCFDDYYHYNIEAMISGPEVATALYEWVSNTDERKRLQVERAANELKKQILLEPSSQKVAAALKTNLKNSSVANENGSTTIAGGGESTVVVSTAAGGEGDNHSLASSSGKSSTKSSRSSGLPIQQQIPSATLTNVTGSDLAKEVREILKNQKLAAESQKQQQQEHQEHQEQLQRKANGHTPIYGESSSSSEVASVQGTTGTAAAKTSALVSAFSVGSGPVIRANDARSNRQNNGGAETLQVFAGLEEMARISRTRQKAMASEVFHDHGEEDEDDGEDDKDGSGADGHGTVSGERIASYQKKQNHDRDDADDADDASTLPAKQATPGRSSRIPTNTNHQALPMTIQSKKRLRWHALVDSGMGRLGFKTDPISRNDQGKRRDTVEILKDLVDLEATLECPIEFYGMCTHMADASNSTSTFTDSQMNRFKSLLRRVRIADISVPTISTDNSAALLTKNLTHFTTNTRELLAQTDADSRGFVRTGGAIYGQRPSFPQLRAVSTLMASVRHVATLKEGESVGYDRAYVAPMNVRIATLTIGFADGYPRELGNGIGRVSIRGHLFPVAGNVCMDMLMVELGPSSDQEGVGAKIGVGDTAILWGPDDGEDGEGHVRLRDIASNLGTTQSALTCGLNRDRVLRRYA